MSQLVNSADIELALHPSHPVTVSQEPPSNTPVSNPRPTQSAGEVPSVTNPPTNPTTSSPPASTPGPAPTDSHVSSVPGLIVPSNAPVSTQGVATNATQGASGQQNGLHRPTSHSQPRPTLIQRGRTYLQSISTKISSNILKPVLYQLYSLGAPITATVIYTLLTWLALTASSVTGPLAHLSPAFGVLVLSIFSKLTDYGLLAAAQTAWDEVLWGPLLQRAKRGGSEGRRGEALVSFFVLMSNWGAWLRVLAYGWWPRWLGGEEGGKKLRGHPRLWSLCRIVVWAVIQFPGIIIMTLVNPRTSYQTIEWTSISGGVGVYDSSLVTGSTLSSFPLINIFMTGILKDSTVTASVNPVNPDCLKAGDSCSGYLLSGGLLLVTPWPFRQNSDKTLTRYMVRDAPAYQIDVWDAPAENITWASGACKIYGSDDQTAFQLCSSLYIGGGNTIVTGWRPCISNILPSGECNLEKSWDTYNYRSTFISIYRRKASFVASRSTGDILSVQNTGPATPQDISPEDFTKAIDTFLWPWNNGSYPQLCEIVSQQVGLNGLMWSALTQGMVGGASTLPLDYLRNLFATALFMFNSAYVGAPVTTSYVDILKGLPAENYVDGSMAREVYHTVPAAWTVYAFIAVGGIILLLIWGVLLTLTPYYGVPKTSSFPFVDLLALRWENLEGSTEGTDDLKNVFPGRARGDDMEVIRQAADVKVFIKDGA